MRRAILLLCLMISSGLAAQGPQASQRSAFDFNDARVKQAKLDDLLRRVQRGEEIAFNEDVYRGAKVTIEAPGGEKSSHDEFLTSGKIRDWVVSCTRADENGVNNWQHFHEIHIIFQCATDKLSGDFRGVFTFKDNLLSYVRIQRLSEKPRYDPVPGWSDEHRARVEMISGLLEAMNRRDRRSFSALGGDKVFFSPDPEAIFSAVVAPRAARLAIDSFAGLRSCKAGRPLSADSDWYTVAWECPSANGVGTSRYSFKFAGRNLVAIQAARPAPKFKFN